MKLIIADLLIALGRQPSFACYFLHPSLSGNTITAGPVMRLQ